MRIAAVLAMVAGAAHSAPLHACASDIDFPPFVFTASSGFAEGAQAAHAAYKLVHPGEALHFEYSTTSGVPKA